MKRPEMIRREAARFEQCDGQRVPHDQLQQRRCRWRQAVRASLRHARQQQHHVGRARQRRGLACCDRDQRNGKAPRIGDDTLEFLAFARPRQGDDGVIPGDHAEIAVIGLRRMDKEGRRAGRGECGRDLRADMTALADACDDDAAIDLRHKVDGLRERLGQSVLECGGQSRDSGLFGRQRSQCRGNRSLPVQLLLF